MSRALPSGKNSPETHEFPCVFGLSRVYLCEKFHYFSVLVSETPVLQSHKVRKFLIPTAYITMFLFLDMHTMTTYTLHVPRTRRGGGEMGWAGHGNPLFALWVYPVKTHAFS